MSEEIKAMNLFQRLHGVMSEVEMIHKKGFNSHHKYNYATESQYVEAIKPLLSKYRLMIIPEIATLMHATDKPSLVDIKMLFTIVNIDNPNEKTIASMGAQGQDNGDKAVYKAITGAKKYFLGVTFAIPTGDDAEEDSPEVADEKPAPKTSSFRRTPKEEKKDEF